MTSSSDVVEQTGYAGVDMDSCRSYDSAMKPASQFLSYFVDSKEKVLFESGEFRRLFPLFLDFGVRVFIPPKFTAVTPVEDEHLD